MIQKLKKSIWSSLAIGCLSHCLAPFPEVAQAGVFEFSVSFSYSRSVLGDEDFQKRRGYGASFGYHFTQLSGVEFSFEDAVTEAQVKNQYQLTMKDRIYSASLVQAILSQDSWFQPYFKGGIAQVNRDIQATYYNVIPVSSRIDELSALVAVGLKIYLSKNIALRGEATSNISRANIRFWKDDIRASTGLSIYF